METGESDVTYSTGKKIKGFENRPTTDEISLDKIRENNDNMGANAEAMAEASRELRRMDPQKLNELSAEYEQAKEENDIPRQEEILKQIRLNSDKVVKLLGVEYNLTKLFGTLMTAIRYIGFKLRGVAGYLLGWLIVLEGIMILVSNPIQFPLQALMALLLKYALLRFLIHFWFHIMSVAKSDIITVAMTAAGKSSARLSPQYIFDFFSDPIVYSFKVIHWWDVGWAFLLAIGFVLCLLLTIEFFMAELEFYLLSGFAIILIPFLGWSQTQGIGSKIGAVLSSQLARLMLMYFFLGATMKVIPANPFPFYSYKGDGMVMCMKYCVILYALYLFVGKSQSLAGSLMSGGAGSMGASDVTRAVTGTVAKGIGLAAAAVGISHGIGKLAKSDAAARGYHGVQNVMRKAANAFSKGSGNSGGGGKPRSGIYE